MEFSLVFKRSGDVLPFTAVNPNLVEYYIQEVNSASINDFAKIGSSIDTITTLLNNLQDTILGINEYIHLYRGKKLDVYQIEEYLDQALLNKYHADWALSHEVILNIDAMRKHTDPAVRAEFDKVHELYPDEIRDVSLSGLLQQRGKLKLYEKINTDIHALEASFKGIILEGNKSEYYSVANKFGDSVMSNDICNLKVSFHVKGRTLYNKFAFYDMDLEYPDENNHDTQSSRIELNLSQPQTIPLSKEYIAWCESRNRVPTGDYLNLGNLTNIWDNITNYRQIVYRNLVNDDHCELYI